MIDPKWFTPKSKLVIYTRTYVELYNQKNDGQIHEIHRMIELEEKRILTAENSRNIDTYQIIEILLVLRSTHLFSRDQNKFVFNYIDWN